MLALNFDGGPVMDAVMWFASGIPNWIPLYLAVLYIVYRNYGWKYMLFALLFVGLGVGLCDQVATFSSGMSPTSVPRIRRICCLICIRSRGIWAA